MGREGERRVGDWAARHRPGSQGAHEFALGDFGLDAAAVRERFSFYLQRFDIEERPETT